MKKLLLVLLFAVTGCATVVNDQSACVTDCNASASYAGIGSDVLNDQSACTHDCNVGQSNGPYRSYYITPNTVYYPYNYQYNRGPVVIYHY